MLLYSQYKYLQVLNDDIEENKMIRIIADSTCNLSREIIDTFDIAIAPLTITIHDKTYVDYKEISPQELYDQLPSLKELPTTAAPSPAVFADIIKADVENNIKEFLVITMSSLTSATYQSAVVGRDNFLETNPDADVRIHIVDSQSMSHGSGYLVLKSCMMRDNGATFDELVAFNETYKTRVKHFLSVGDLDNLVKSGRLSHTSAIVGKVLRVEPIMTMKSGRGAIVGKVRGHKNVLRYYVDEYKKRVDTEMTDFVIIGYTSDISYAKALQNLFVEETGFKGEIYIIQMGATVGTHVGLGGVSMFFIEKPKAHNNIYMDKISEMKTAVTNKVKEQINNYKK